jgi:hypothetical protein
MLNAAACAGILGIEEGVRNDAGSNGSGGAGGAVAAGGGDVGVGGNGGASSSHDCPVNAQEDWVPDVTSPLALVAASYGGNDYVFWLEGPPTAASLYRKDAVSGVETELVNAIDQPFGLAASRVPGDENLYFGTQCDLACINLTRASYLPSGPPPSIALDSLGLFTFFDIVLADVQDKTRVYIASLGAVLPYADMPGASDFSTFSVPGAPVIDIEADEQHVYMALESDGMARLAHSASVVEAIQNVTDTVNRLTVSETYVYFTDGTGLWRFDKAMETPPEQHGGVMPGSRQVVVDDRAAYVLTEGGDVFCTDHDDTTGTSVHIMTASEPYALAVDDHAVYVGSAAGSIVRVQK